MGGGERARRKEEGEGGKRGEERGKRGGKRWGVTDDNVNLA